MTKGDLAEKLLASLPVVDPHGLRDDVARLIIHGNQVVGLHGVPGLEVDARELPDGIDARIRVKRGARIADPVHLCFGLLPSTGLQRIVLDLEAEEGSYASVQAHCTFPNAVEVTHRMDAEIRIAPGATYEYFERHVHGPEGGVLVLPNARVRVGEGARFKTEFELLKGRVGKIDIRYETTCEANGVAEMIARIIGRGDDEIRIEETAHLVGADSTAVLRSYLALRDRARAEILNTMVATAPGARGHVDCKEIVQDSAQASAVPVVQVRNPTAHVTHEAAIGSVDSKQLQTLLARGLTEDAAVDLIIDGLLSR